MGRELGHSNELGDPVHRAGSEGARLGFDSRSDGSQFLVTRSSGIHFRIHSLVADGGDAQIRVRHCRSIDTLNTLNTHQAPKKRVISAHVFQRIVVVSFVRRSSVSTLSLGFIIAFDGFRKALDACIRQLRPKRKSLDLSHSTAPNRYKSEIQPHQLAQHTAALWY